MCDIARVLKSEVQWIEWRRASLDPALHSERQRPLTINRDFPLGLKTDATDRDFVARPTLSLVK